MGLLAKPVVPVGCGTGTCTDKKMKNLQEEIDAWSAAAIVLATVVGFVLVLCVILMLSLLTQFSASTRNQLGPASIKSSGEASPHVSVMRNRSQYQRPRSCSRNHFTGGLCVIR